MKKLLLLSIFSILLIPSILLASQSVDYTCLFDCIKKYSYGFCRNLCSYEKDSYYKKHRILDYGCYFYCIKKYSSGYCREICSYELNW